MINEFIKYFSLFFFTTQNIFKFLGLQNNVRKRYFFTTNLSLVLAFIMGIFKHYSLEQGLILLLLLIWFVFNTFIPNPKTTFLATILSFVINYCIFAVAGFISLLVLFPFFPKQNNFPLTLLIVVTVIIQAIFTIPLMQHKRLKNGMPFLFSTTVINISTIICLLILGYTIYRFSSHSQLWIRTISPFIFILILLALINWWQAQITKSYKQALINRELESLRMELEEKEKQLAEVSARNEELGRLIHKDNKRLPAMEHAISEFLVMDLDDKEKAVERANTLLIEIQKLSDDRNSTVTEIYARKYKHHDYGINEVDNMLNYMEKRAYREHIKLSVQTAIHFDDFVPKHISAEDLSHVLSDLLENAIIAAKHSPSPVIQLQFYKSGKDFVIEIADNGIPFEAVSLVNFGLEQITTHADTGGSGIGLMDIWKNKEKYGASLHITEYKDDAPYTKKIALIFNKKNRYTISTERKEELLSLSKRTDLQIF